MEACLHRLPVKPGDCVFIPAGTVHAIGEGVLLAEVQQSSDLTFRLFDWNRLGADGQPRPLHIEQSLDCTNFERGPISASVATLESTQGGVRLEQLAVCPYFNLHRLAGVGLFELATADRCRIWIITAGGVGWHKAGGGLSQASQGTTLLWPAVAQPTLLTFRPGTEVIEATWD